MTDPTLAPNDGAASVDERRRRKRKRRRKLRQVAATVVPWIASPFLRLLSGTWKIREIHPEHRDAARSEHGCIATIWHGRMLLPLRTYGNKGVRVLVSPSADGSLITGILERLGFGSVRGSSSRNSTGAVREMVARLEGGDMIVITPDGPKGPRHTMTGGPTWVAKATGYPIIPVGLVCDRAWYANSWDRFTIPKLGAQVAIVYGELVYVSDDASAESLREAGETVRARMLEAEEEGFAALGAERDW